MRVAGKISLKPSIPPRTFLVLTVIISAVTLAVAVVLPSVQVITMFTGATGEKALALPDCSTPGHVHGTR